MKQTKELMLHWQQSFDGGDIWNLFICDMSAYGHVFVGKQKIEFEVPDDFNPVPIQIAMLEAEKQKAMDEFNKRVAVLNEQISKLTCLTFEAEVSHGQ